MRIASNCTAVGMTVMKPCIAEGKNTLGWIVELTFCLWIELQAPVTSSAARHKKFGGASAPLGSMRRGVTHACREKPYNVGKFHTKQHVTFGGYAPARMGQSNCAPTHLL